MIVVQLKGRLGNQMFQYAFSKSYASRGHQVFLDLNAYSSIDGLKPSVKYELASLFKVTVPELPKWGYDYLYSGRYAWRALRKCNVMRIKRVWESDLRYNESFLNFTGNVWFSGYFQNEKYFIDIENEIRRDFVFSQPIPERLRAIFDDILRSESVSIHVRRGDFVTTASNSHGVLPLSYYREAILHVQTMTSSPKFFIFTDDPGWVKRSFAPILTEYVLVEHQSNQDSLADIFLMSRCKHNITANSSFSWWGAWLNDSSRKLVITPKRWCLDPLLDSQISDIVPRGWLRIDII